MNLYSWFQLILYIGVLLVLAKPLGSYIARVYEGERTFLDRVLGPVERFIYRISGIDPRAEMDWKVYAIAMLLFNVLGLFFVYVLQRLQGVLPLNPHELGAVTPDSSWNTAVSFASNTNWQGYGGETTMSYLTQMLGLTVQNFVSAATGMAVLVAFIRGIAKHTTKAVGNFWVDMTRSTLYILLPLSFVLALALVSQGVVQTFSEYKTVSFLQPTSDTPEQVIAVGPAASQIAIKQLGTNGGGFFNVNSSHPFENPTPLSNFLEMLSILLIPAALCYTFGKMVGDTRQGWALLATMTIIFVGLLDVTVWAEQTCHRRFQEWVEKGVFEEVLRALVRDVNERAGLDLTECFIDGSFVIAKKGAAGWEKPSGAKVQSSWQWQMALVFLSPYPLEVLRRMK